MIFREQSVVSVESPYNASPAHAYIHYNCPYATFLRRHRISNARMLPLLRRHETHYNHKVQPQGWTNDNIARYLMSRSEIAEVRVRPKFEWEELKTCILNYLSSMKYRDHSGFGIIKAIVSLHTPLKANAH